MKAFYLGRECPIVYKGGRGLSSFIAKDDATYEIHIVGQKAYIKRRIIDLYKKQAREIIKPLVVNYCLLLKVQYQNLSFKDTKTRWGSASSLGNLSFNWRLIMAPMEIIKYVVAHEVAHLVEMNHQKKFWLLCEKLCVDSRNKHKWLRLNGYKFMQVNFNEQLV